MAQVQSHKIRPQFIPGTESTGRWVGALAAVVAAVSYSSFLAERWTHSTLSGSRAFISSLEAAGQPWAWAYRVSDVVAGLAMALLAVVLWHRFGRDRVSLAAAVLLAAAGLSSVIDGATSMRCSGTIDAACAAAERNPSGMLAQLGDLHVDSGVGGLVGVCGAAILFGAGLRGSVARDRMGRCWVVLGAVVGLSGLADVVVLLTGGDIGTVERFRTLVSSLWLLAVGGWLLATSSQPLDQSKSVGRRGT